MKRTVTANLAGRVFHIDEDAYHLLARYLSHPDIKVQPDTEAQLAEKLSEKLSGYKEVVDINDIQAVLIAQGLPNGFINAAGPTTVNTGTVYYKRLFRDRESKVLGGVCSGLGHYFTLDPILLRIVFLILFFGMGLGLLFYIIMWIIVPEARTAEDIAQMKQQRL